MIAVQRVSSIGTRSYRYATDIVRSRRLILELTRREFRSRHLGSALGLIWAFIHPAVMMTIYYLVFNYALKEAGRNPINGAPFLIWLLAGLVPWFIISDMLAGGSSTVTDNRFLVKKVVFQITLLPIVRLLSNLPVHLFLVAVITCIFWTYGYRPCWYNLQIFYFLFALMVLGLGWSLLMSAIVPFLKDLSQIVQVILQIAFWVTPLIWNVETAGPKVQHLAYLNPACYIVQGYRDSLIYYHPFWFHPLFTAYFWAFALMMLMVGGMVFTRLKPHFADVL